MRVRLALCLLPLSMACTSVNSKDLLTAGMSADMHVIADGSGSTSATAVLHVDNNCCDFVDLQGNDRLVASAGGQSQTMAKDTFVGTVSYDASFNGQDAEGAQYTIALSRTSDKGAPNSNATLPKPFGVSAPAANASASRAHDLVVSWSPSGTSDKMSWRADGSCIGIATGDIVGDSGNYTIPAGTLKSANPKQSTASCSITITVLRTRSGQLDPNFGYGGTIWAAQQRQVQITLTP